jgi:hypothetical protein
MTNDPFGFVSDQGCLSPTFAFGFAAGAGVGGKEWGVLSIGTLVGAVGSCEA